MSEYGPDSAHAKVAIGKGETADHARWEESGSRPSEYDHISDEELIELLESRVHTLDYQLKSAEERTKDLSLLPSSLLLAVAVVLLVLVFGLAMAPYFIPAGTGSREVPTVLTLVAAFGILIFGYLTYRAFANLLAMIEMRRSLRYDVNDGKRALERAESLIKEVRASEAEASEAGGLT